MLPVEIWEDLRGGDGERVRGEGEDRMRLAREEGGRRKGDEARERREGRPSC